MFLFVAAIIATVMPPIGALTVMGAMSKRWSSQGALVGLIAGFASAIGLLALDYAGYLTSVAEDSSFFRGLVTFICTVVATIIVSLFEELNGLVIKPGNPEQFSTSTARENEYVEPASTEVHIITGLLAAVIVAVYCAIAVEMGRSH